MKIVEGVQQLDHLNFVLTNISGKTVVATSVGFRKKAKCGPHEYCSTAIRNGGKLFPIVDEVEGAGDRETVLVLPPNLYGELAMSSYQIHYLNRQKALACLMVAQCASDDDARDFATSLQGITHRTVEIWRGDTLVYEGFNPRIAN